MHSAHNSHKQESISSIKQSPSYLSSLKEIADQYDAYFIDLWGVTHNGVKPFPYVNEIYSYLKNQGKHLFVLSNAPRLPEVTQQRLKEIGINPQHFQGIYTSGYECNRDLIYKPDDFYQSLGESFYHLGPTKDATVFKEIPYSQVYDLNEANFIILTGTFDWEQSVKGYLPLLQRALDYNLPLICANADKIVNHAGKICICAGAIAEEYSKMGAKNVRIHGKPSPYTFEGVYQLACRHLEKTLNKDRILMIGDSLSTDIKGANNFGIDSVLTLSGIHANTSSEDFELLFHEFKATPSYIISEVK